MIPAIGLAVMSLATAGVFAFCGTLEWEWLWLVWPWIIAEGLIT